jgi:formylglycine-generating enzyme required for sulfatase activity
MPIQPAGLRQAVLSRLVVRRSLKRKVNLAASLAVLLALLILAPGRSTNGATIKAPAVVALQPHPFHYRLAGDFTRDGKPANAPMRMVQLDRVVTIMVHQVTAADYQRCVLDHACPPARNVAVAADRPAVKISWHDANAYAAWLSRQLGATYRLPTDEEWVFAAGSRFRDQVLPDGTVDPAQRWLASYELEANRDEALDNEPRSIGSFGANDNGVLDLAGNVWEWTNTCFVRQTLNLAGAGASIINCGVRVVEGRHRTYMTDFIRDPRAGGCSVGKPPSNLGFRLARENGPWEWLQSLIAQDRIGAFRG